MLLVCILVTCAALEVVIGQHVDLTLSPRTSGKDVVESVVGRIRSNCIFTNDRLFLRRLAYVESKDGADTKTYRNGYSGGIWQVDEEKFNATRKCSFIIAEECHIIASAFNISWEDTEWTDLEKPLYSGLAASLYMLLRLGFTGSIPGDLHSQAETWSHYYHLGQPDIEFETGAKAVQEVCKAKIDVVFIIDSSGSIYFTDYMIMMIFIQNITRNLEYGPEAAQIAAVVYGTDANVAFYFDTYSTQADVITALSKVPKDNGGTKTFDAIDLTHFDVFSPNHGARDGVAKVVILLTDGASGDYNLTVEAAEQAKQAGIIFFTIGIGSINRMELAAVASDPSCTHMFVLDNFSEIESVLSELRKGSCSAPKVLTGSIGSGENTTFNGTHGVNQIREEFNGSITSTIKIDNMWTFVSGSGEIVKAEVTCGVLDLYTSFETPHPGPAFFEEKFTAKDGQPVIINLLDKHHGKPMYITVVATQLPSTPENAEKCRNPHYRVSITKKHDLQILCRESGVLRNCTKLDYIHAELPAILCDNHHMSAGKVDNPCTKENLANGKLIHPYPLDTNSFIKCDLTGKMYITLCPQNEIFNKESSACGFHSVSIPNNGSPLPSYIANPCTAEQIQKQEYFFPYPNDKHAFIHCDVWGGAWVQHCKAHYLWNNIARTCVEDFFREFESTTSSSGVLHNPCQVGSGLYFYPHPDETKYIHCDVAGNYWVQSCQLEFRYNPIAHVCVPKPGFQVGK